MAPAQFQAEPAKVSESRILWALSLSQLPASLYEEVRGIAAPVLLAKQLGAGRKAALGLAHIFLLELLLAFLATRARHLGCCKRRRRRQEHDGDESGELQGLGGLMLLAVCLNMAGLTVMVAAGALATGAGASSAEGRPVQIFILGHVLYSLGSMVREAVFPTLATCFSEEVIVQLNAQRHVLLHLGALLGGCVVAAGFFRCYVAMQALGMLLGLRALLAAVPALDALKPSRPAELKTPWARPVRAVIPTAIDSPPSPSSPASFARLSLLVPAAARSRASVVCSSFSLLVLARFVQSVGFAFSSPVIVLSLLRVQGVVNPAGTGSSVDAARSAWVSEAQLLACSSVLGHMAGLAVNLCIGRLRPHFGVWHLLLSGIVYAGAIGALPAVLRPQQYLAISMVARGARAMGKAASDAVAFRAARRLGQYRTAALFARRTAFKLGLLTGKYSVAPLLTAGEGALPMFGLIFGVAAATSFGGVGLQALGSP